MCVRVPVMVGHGIASTMFFDRTVEVEEANEVLSDAPGVQVWGDDNVPTPLDSAGIDDVLVGRLRATIVKLVASASSQSVTTLKGRRSMRSSSPSAC